MRRLLLVMVAAVALLAAGCTSGNSTTKAGPTTVGTGATGTTAGGDASKAPGVTASSIKIGVTYVDAKAVQASGLDLTLGDYPGSYTALINQINATGGINGRKIQVVFAPINPIGTAPADAACLHLTEDEKVFVAVGFFLNDAVLCPVQTHSTSVIGGGQTPQLMARATAPWFTTQPGSEVPVKVVDAFDKKDLLSGKVAVFAQVADQDLLNNQIMPELAKLGIKPVDKAVLDAPAGDTAAITSGTQVIAQKFKSEGATKVLLVGPSSADWFLGMAGQSYQPQLLVTDTTAANAYLSSSATHDYSLMNNSVEGGAYGPDTWVFTDPRMQACFAIIKKAGIAVPAPDPSDANQKGYTGPEDACVNVTLLKDILEKAGKTLNYATFQQAGYTLGATYIPGDPTARHYGPPPATDGNPTVYLATWDAASKSYVHEKGS